MCVYILVHIVYSFCNLLFPISFYFINGGGWVLCQEAWSSNHWTAREFPYFIKYFLPQFHQQPSLVLDPPTLSLSCMLAIIRDCLASESWNLAQWTCRPAQVPPTFLSGSQSVGPSKYHWLPLNRHFHSQDHNDRGKFQQADWKGPGTVTGGGEHTLPEQSQVSEPSTQRGSSRPGEPEAGECGSVGNLNAGSSAARQSYQGLKRMFCFQRNLKANLPS